MRLKSMLTTMQKDGIPEDIRAPFEQIAQRRGGEAEMEFVDKMDELLTEEQRLSIWERNGGCRLGRRNQEALAFRTEHADKTIEEKVEQLKSTRFMSNITRNEDGTFTAGNGCHLCVLKHRKPPYTASSTVFGCSAGGALHNYKIALGAKLKLKVIDSFLLDPDATEPYSFTFEIVE
ncbi:hypothetical protein [Gorillibacterium sp. CAU 1737]|uniref:hypothetical protein n=1 Tax=Gorillibacterium sp. CAU 1737 TaxID=3140362 RepID=UPI0032615A85